MVGHSLWVYSEYLCYDGEFKSFYVEVAVIMLLMLCEVIKLYYIKFYDKVIFLLHISIQKTLRVLICKYVTGILILKYLVRRISGRFMNSDI